MNLANKATQKTPVLMRPFLQWIYCLSRNEEYSKYCEAKRVGQASVCDSLEDKFPKLQEVYQDWGDVFAFDLIHDPVAQRLWWNERMRLFLDLPMVSWIDNPQSYTPRSGYELVELPLLGSKAETLNLVKQHLDFVYKYREAALEKSTKPLAKIVYQQRPKPKYIFHSKGSKLSAAAKLALQKAFYVDELRQKTNDKGKPLSLTETVLAIKQDPENPFGWALTEEDKRDLQRGVFKKGLFWGSEVTLVRRARSDFDAYVRNTIHGRFPDNS